MQLARLQSRCAKRDGLGALGVSDARTGVGERNTAGRREPNRPREPLEEWTSEQRLERLNLVGQAGLADVELVGGGGEGALINDRDEVFELAKRYGHASSLSMPDEVSLGDIDGLLLTSCFMKTTSSSRSQASPDTRRARRLLRTSAVALAALCAASLTAVASGSAVKPGPTPYAYLPKVPSFTLTSQTVSNGHPLPAPQLSKLFKVPGGKDISPQLSWRGFPKTTKSFIVSMYDPEAPTGSGFWHWVVVDLPASTTSLPADAGRAGGGLPGKAFDLLGDAGVHQYVGGAPPAGSGIHDYYITVTALNVASLPGVGRETSAAYVGFVASGYTVARATIVCPTEAAK
jgi:hypothetical protein